MDLKNKKVLVTGGTGMIGSAVVELLLQKGAEVTAASIDKNIFGKRVNYSQIDLRSFADCIELCKDTDVVFNMTGVKGSPKMTQQKPASFFVPMLQFNTNMMEAARLANVEWYLYTSSIGVYGDFESPEDDLWESYPSKNDWFAGWAKRIGEMQARAYEIQYNWDQVSIVRPGNVFGPRDNFDPNTGMVIPSLISKIETGQNPIKVWGDGSAVRDFIYSREVAAICIFLVENEIKLPVNAGTGVGISIRDLVERILLYTKNKPVIEWDTSQPTGDQSRILNVRRLKNMGYEYKYELDDGIVESIEWFRANNTTRYDVFYEK